MLFWTTIIASVFVFGCLRCTKALAIIRMKMIVSVFQSIGIGIFMSWSPEHVIRFLITDHEMIACSRKINNIRYNPKTVECTNYTNYSPEKLRSNVIKIDWSPVYDATDVNLAVHYFISSLQVVFRTHAPILKNMWRVGRVHG